MKNPLLTEHCHFRVGSIVVELEFGWRLQLAAFYQPVFSSTLLRSADFVAGLVAFLLLAFWRRPPWLVVGAGLGWVLQA